MKSKTRGTLYENNLMKSFYRNMERKNHSGGINLMHNHKKHASTYNFRISLNTMTNISLITYMLSLFTFTLLALSPGPALPSPIDGTSGAGSDLGRVPNSGSPSSAGNTLNQLYTPNILAQIRPLSSNNNNNASQSVLVDSSNSTLKINNLSSPIAAASMSAPNLANIGVNPINGIKPAFISANSLYHQNTNSFYNNRNHISTPYPIASYVPQQSQQPTNFNNYLNPQTIIFNNNQNQPLQSISNNINIINNPFTKAANDILLDLRQQMLTRSLKFDEQFRQLLSSSKISLHTLFYGTYGILYQRNTEIFTSMFESLEQYYANGRIQLHQSMQNFFDDLYQKIFQVLNASKVLDEDYLKCATEQMSRLKPFKDIPERLTDDIIKAFVSARTFYQALIRGIEVIKKVISLGQSPVCAHLITEKLLTNHAQGPPCLNYCEQIITRCVGKESLEKLNEQWKAYVMALDELASRLSTSHNFEAIIIPLEVKISEAIMNFQENGENITFQVNSICGQQTSSHQGGANGALMAPGSHLSSSAHHLRPTTNNNRIRKRATLIASRANGINRVQSSMATSMSPSDKPTGNQLLPRTFSGSPSPTLNSGRSYDASGYNMRQSRPPPPPPITHRSSSQLDGSQDEARDSGEMEDVRVPELSMMQKRKFKSTIMVDEIRTFMSKTKNFWSSLPNAVCMTNYANNNTKPIAVASPSGSTSNKRGQQQSCYQESMPQFDINNYDQRHKIEITQAVNSLVDMKAKIMIALEGKEIDWSANGGAAGPVQAVKYPSINLISTTTTTTQAPPPSSPNSFSDDDDNSENSEDILGPDNGSGSAGEDVYPSEEDDLDDKGLDETTAGTTDIDNTDEQLDTTANPDNSIDSVTEQPAGEKDKNDNTLNRFIVPPDFQKSGQSSSVLVISGSFNAMLIIVASFYVCRFVV